ncbi:hypothetical protein BO70DRAFT_201169 [Aspergillus heteromorphus CBS 117.55]|uniref:Uncharacterized protein n=1 Tax=Aspergillus heteromorphus CBS 117.55 TaxID=1448321 RepID=A0A317WR23_9EURO|nr:uncharacterized protein BO70DRAFT_201169 [Aspergillus heteromorphus CBS 117.55]PWY87722.1 hypothetical protein BO70DRAFT_201169 [Aspergillus heteromorphus CBS 117.55]
MDPLRPQHRHHSLCLSLGAPGSWLLALGLWLLGYWILRWSWSAGRPECGRSGSSPSPGCFLGKVQKGDCKPGVTTEYLVDASMDGAGCWQRSPSQKEGVAAIYRATGQSARPHHLIRSTPAGSGISTG